MTSATRTPRTRPGRSLFVSRGLFRARWGGPGVAGVGSLVGSGVTCPKSRLSGCEAGHAGLGVVPGLSSRARQRREASFHRTRLKQALWRGWPGGLRRREDPLAQSPYAVLHISVEDLVSRSVHRLAAASNLPGSSGTFAMAFLHKLTGPTSAPFRVRTDVRIRQVMRDDQRRSWSTLSRFPVAFRPPALASWAILPPLGDQRHSRSAHQPRGWAPTGLSRSTRSSYDRGGCPLYPEAHGVS